VKRIAETSAGRAKAVVWAVVALTVISIVLALGLDASASPGTLFDRDRSASKATDRLYREFGGDPVLVVVHTRKEGCPGGRDCRLTDLLLTPDLVRLLSLEGCVSGNIPRRAKAPAPVCDRFRKTKPFEIVNGPGTFINESARQLTNRIRSQQRSSAVEVKRASEAARKVAAARGLSPADQEKLAKQARQLALLNALQPALRYGLSPRGAGIGDPSFVHQLVFEPSISFDAPKTRFTQYFPSRTSAVLELRPRPGLSKADTRAAIGLVREAVGSPSFRLKSSRFVVTGQPVAALGVEEDISDSLLILLVAALVAVTAAVALAARFTRVLFVPLAVTVAAVALTLGSMSVLGATLTIASIAVLPVLAGIAAGIALQFTRTGVLSLGSAGAAAIGFAVLVISPVPMVRTFGAFVALGIVLSLALTLTLGSALLRGGGRASSPARPARRPLQFLRTGWARLTAHATRRPRTVLGVAALVALLGWLLAPQSQSVSGLDRLAPGGVREVKDLKALERESRMERGVNVVVTADDVTNPKVIPWMVAYQRKVLRRHGYTETKPCAAADLCPTVALADLFGEGRRRSRAQTRRLLDQLPRYFTQGVISRDLRTANISFLIRHTSIDRQQDVIADMRRQLDPPAGVHAELGGETVLVADAADFGFNSRTLALLALAVLLSLLVATGVRSPGAIRTRFGPALVSIVPLAIAAGWSALILYALGVDLNPMSATLGALVVGFGGYGMIVLSDRYREARASGQSPEAAVTRAYGQGSVLLASGFVALTGFAILIVPDVRMLRDFGAVAVFDLVIVLAVAALVFPAALVWAEQRKPLSLRRSPAEFVAAARAGLAKVRAGASRLPRRRGEAQGP
jgi:predicted RND superfamily exporter protein